MKEIMAQGDRVATACHQPESVMTNVPAATCTAAGITAIEVATVDGDGALLSMKSCKSCTVLLAKR